MPRLQQPGRCCCCCCWRIVALTLAACALLRAHAHPGKFPLFRGTHFPFDNISLPMSGSKLSHFVSLHPSVSKPRLSFNLLLSSCSGKRLFGELPEIFIIATQSLQFTARTSRSRSRVVVVVFVWYFSTLPTGLRVSTVTGYSQITSSSWGCLSTSRHRYFPSSSLLHHPITSRQSTGFPLDLTPE